MTLLAIVSPSVVAQDTARGAAIERLERLAKKGNARAQSQLGSIYYGGKNGVQKDYSLAVYWFTKAAEQGYLNAVFNLALCHERGRGVPKNTAEALRLYRRAADEGLLQAQINAAVILLEMDDDAAANKYLHLGAAKGNFYCQREYARNLLQGRGTEKDFDRAIALLDAAADGGDAEAKLLLADCYSGMYPSIPRDTQQMVDYLWSAASDGVPEAQSKMGYCYEKGIGVAADQETAFKWYGQAAEKNYPQAMVNLGHCYQAGVGTAKDEKKAYEWYKKAAEMDFAVGLFNLGIFYMTGGPVARNERIAFSYFERAAKLGFVQAQYNLAVAYEEGKGADINRPMAFFWYKQAARQEYPAAITGLGYCYYRGFGIKQDHDRAKELFIQAKDLNNDEARFALRSLKWGPLDAEERAVLPPVTRRARAEDLPALPFKSPSRGPIATKDTVKPKPQVIQGAGGFLQPVRAD